MEEWIADFPSFTSLYFFSSFYTFLFGLALLGLMMFPVAEDFGGVFGARFCRRRAGGGESVFRGFRG